MSTTNEGEIRTAKAEYLVRNCAIAAVVPGVIPIPLLDMALITGVQLKMLKSLADVYETPFSEQRSRSAISSLVGGAGSGSLSLVASRLLRPVPVIGQIAGLATMSAFGAASTYALGKVFIQHFESGGTFLTFEPQRVKDYYDQQVEDSQPNASAGRKPP